MKHFPDPPAWGMLAGTLGQLLVYTGILAFAGSVVANLIYGCRGRIANIAFYSGAVAVALTFVCHIVLLLGRQYEYGYVFENTREDMPGIYRLSAAWASQQGSFLLWTLLSTAVAAIAMRRTGIYSRWFSIVSGTAIAAMLSITAYESPFKLLVLGPQDKALLAPGQSMVMPPDGMGMNPTLMNYWMAIHPWVIFIGFGSLLTLFAWTASASIRRDFTTWLPAIRPYAIFSMLMLGVGLTMGGLWAYETLGWGGFWAWDPVENVSLVPFLASTVFVHGLLVQSSRRKWVKLNALLGMLPFLWFVYGTYLTRSGALVKVSVHSFAEMNAGAHGLLLAMVVATLATTLALTVRAFAKGGAAEEQRDGDRQIGLNLGMVALYSVALMAAVGMSLPFFFALLHKNQEVIEESNYNMIVVFPFIPAMLAMAIVPFLGWTKTVSQRWQLLGNIFFFTVLLFAAIVFAITRAGLTLEPESFTKLPAGLLAILYVTVFACLFSITANAFRLFERIRAGTGNIGPFLTHAGVSLLLLGLIISHAFEKRVESHLTPSEPARLALLPNQTYIAMLDGLPPPESFDKSNNALPFRLINDRTGKEDVIQANFYYSDRGGEFIPVSRPAIERGALYDLYFVVRPPETELANSVTLLPGQEQVSGQYKIKYLQPTQKGKPGMAGTRFGAKLQISIKGKTYAVEPQIEIDPGSGIRKQRAQIPQEGVEVELTRIGAADRSATISLVSPDLIFPVELFYKPLTSMVWLGAGMMTFGGILSIRKRKQGVKSSNEAPQSSQIESSPRAGELCES